MPCSHFQVWKTKKVYPLTALFILNSVSNSHGEPTNYLSDSVLVMEKPQDKGWIRKLNLLEVSEFAGSPIKACEHGLPLGDDPSRLPPTHDPGNLIVGHGEVGRSMVEAKLRAVLHHLPTSINTPQNGNRSVRARQLQRVNWSSTSAAPCARRRPGRSRRASRPRRDRRGVTRTRRPKLRSGKRKRQIARVGSNGIVRECGGLGAGDGVRRSRCLLPAPMTATFAAAVAEVMARRFPAAGTWRG
jgi:hypothetical protein